MEVIGEYNDEKYRSVQHIRSKYNETTYNQSILDDGTITTTSNKNSTSLPSIHRKQKNNRAALDKIIDRCTSRLDKRPLLKKENEEKYSVMEDVSAKQEKLQAAL
mmetsp:Transcript_35840/g.34880  ORF Transcript_35840/g.34880 Transcript_35840/m.34880 type:complete len:105 (+) Transcript_35840:224-538(+)